MKVINVQWFGSTDPAIGLVVAENSVGKRKAYIAPIDGYSTQGDINHVIALGTKVPASRLEEVLNALKETGNYE